MKQYSIPCLPNCDGTTAYSTRSAQRIDAAWDSVSGDGLPRKIRPATAPATGSSSKKTGRKQQRQRQFPRACEGSELGAEQKQDAGEPERRPVASLTRAELRPVPLGKAQLLRSDRLNNDPQVSETETTWLVGLKNIYLRVRTESRYDVAKSRTGMENQHSAAANPRPTPTTRSSALRPRAWL